MIKYSLWLIWLWPLLGSFPTGLAQAPSSWSADSLTVEAIMRDPAWMGHAPEQVRWSPDGQQILFRWNPNPTPGDSLYAYHLRQEKVAPVAPGRRESLLANLSYGPKRRQAVYEKEGDIYWVDLRKGEHRNLTQTTAAESQPSFSRDGKRVFFLRRNNYFALDLDQPQLQQLTRIRKGGPSSDPETSHEQQRFIEQQERQLIQGLSPSTPKSPSPGQPFTFFCGNQQPEHFRISPNGRYVTFRLKESPQGSSRTEVPRYINAAGYADRLNARPKVGSPQPTYDFAIYDVERDTVLFPHLDQVPGILTPLASDLPVVMLNRSGDQNDGAAPDLSAAMVPREVIFTGPEWSDQGQALVELRSLDFKDRWLMRLDPATGDLQTLDRQHDDAWIDGPGIGRWLGARSEMGWIPGTQTVWFLSEESGYANLYTYSLTDDLMRNLTRGPYEVSGVQVARDGNFFYFTSNQTHPGERHFYRLPVGGGYPERLTSLPGWNEVTLSPDEKYLAIRHSKPNLPWELYLQKNKPGAEAEPLTQSLSEEFQSYPWRLPEYHVIEARDGGEIYARLYRPKELEPGGPAVIFVHGAGYLQNAHKGWSSYFREYMFHNLLADQGYLVLDVDYRGSAGYGRDWRTGVYRHMGGQDLDDHVDAAQWLAQEWEVDPQRIGIYGGSYGGFITLMAMFTQPGVFACGAALRPVTDWAHYNHAYTAPMLNLPQADSVAYQRSSPIYHAEGLEGSLLICHGMVDTNVHFQDVVRLTQRLIELGKDDWDVAFYPMEGHAFTQPSSWTDEYRRIYQLFERELKP